MNSNQTPVTMKEEQIKEIKEELLKTMSHLDKANKASFLMGARKLNISLCEKKAVPYNDFLLLDDMLGIEIEINLTLAGS